ncbi:hypothetical protein GGP55_003122 [Salinibacter ruber]|uniref:N-acetylneuraminate synthase family protein n=1 Tax=Salinibacter ruber TaxID=146919 RepID=UPI00245214F0|nr:hypothetical protein [Salinibacter ruber]
MGSCAVSVSPFDVSAVEILEHLTVVSSGIAPLGVIGEAVRAFRDAGGTELALLTCTNSYPAPPEKMHLRHIPHLAETFDVLPGLSDHTLGTEVPVAGVSFGARITEEHLTLSREEEGSIHRLLARASRVCRKSADRSGARRAFEEALYKTTVKELDSKPSIEEHARSIRLGDGLASKYLDTLWSNTVVEHLVACQFCEMAS